MVNKKRNCNLILDENQVAEIPGNATITVTAEDGETSLVYTISFYEIHTVTFYVFDE